MKKSRHDCPAKKENGLGSGKPITKRYLVFDEKNPVARSLDG